MQISRHVRARMITRVIVCLLLSIYDKDMSYTKVYTLHALFQAKKASFCANFSLTVQRVLCCVVGDTVRMSYFNLHLTFAFSVRVDSVYS